MLANFQDGVKDSNRGQTGFLRIVDIDVKKKQIRVETYSPYLKEYRVDDKNRFTFEGVNFK